MATRAIHRLKGTQITGKREPGRYADGGGLYLQVGPTGGKAWLFRFMLQGKSREMGLGPLNTIDVAQARNEAAECRRLVLAGIDPIEARNAGRMQALIEASRSKTFKECAKAFIEAHQSGWKNAKHAAQWSATLDTYAYPKLGDLPVSVVDTSKVVEVLEADKLWTTKTETAVRVRGRIEKVLDWAAARGYPDWQGANWTNTPPGLKIVVYPRLAFISPTTKHADLFGEWTPKRVPVWLSVAAMPTQARLWWLPATGN